MSIRLAVAGFLLGQLLVTVSQDADALGEPEKSVTVVFAYAKPHIYIGEDGPSGNLIGVLRYVFETELGYALKFSQMPWLRAQADIRFGLADIIVTVPTDDRRQYAYVTNPAVVTLEKRLYSRADHPRFAEMANVRSIEDLLKTGLSVSTNIGDGWHRQYVEGRGVPTWRVPDLTHSFSLLIKGRTDIVLASSSDFNHISEVRDLQGKVRNTGGRVEPLSSHILISKLSQLGKRIADIDAILEKWVDKEQN